MYTIIRDWPDKLMWRVRMLILRLYMHVPKGVW